MVFLVDEYPKEYCPLLAVGVCKANSPSCPLNSPTNPTCSWLQVHNSADISDAENGLVHDLT